MHVVIVLRREFRTTVGFKNDTTVGVETFLWKVHRWCIREREHEHVKL